MKKSERLNDMLRFLNEKKQFNLSDIMSKYEISKSTALRDLTSLEKIGLAFYSDAGRYGKYVLLNNQVLPTIRFTENELFALYMSLLMIKEYRSLPFTAEFQQIRQKFLENVSPRMRQQLHLFENKIQFENQKHPYASLYLKEVLYYSINEAKVVMFYNKKEYTVQFYQIISRFNQWYVQAYDYGNRTIKTFRCDKIEGLNKLEADKGLAPERISKLAGCNKLERSCLFKVEISSSLVDEYYKENYPTIKLKEECGHYFLCGQYHPMELDFVLSYLAKFVSGMIQIEPVALKAKLLDYFHKQVSHLQKL